jgi:hypothetical protein
MFGFLIFFRNSKVHLAFIANTFAYWMNGKMNSGTSVAYPGTSRLHSAAHSGTSRLGESTEKLLKAWSNVTCIQALRLWYKHTIEQSMLRLSSTLLVDRSTTILRRWRGTCGFGRYDAGESRRSSRWAGQMGRIYKP